MGGKFFRIPHLFLGEEKGKEKKIHIKVTLHSKY